MSFLKRNLNLITGKINSAYQFGSISILTRPEKKAMHDNSQQVETDLKGTILPLQPDIPS